MQEHVLELKLACKLVWIMHLKGGNTNTSPNRYGKVKQLELSISGMKATVCSIDIKAKEVPGNVYKIG